MACLDDLHHLSTETRAAVNAEALNQIEKTSAKEKKAITKLEALLEALIQVEGSSSEKGGEAQTTSQVKGLMASDILKKLGPQLKECINENPAKGAKKLKEIFFVLEDFASESPKAASKTAAGLSSVLKNVATSSPKGYIAMADAFSDQDPKMKEQKIKLKAALTTIDTLLSGPNSEKAEEAMQDFTSRVADKYNLDTYKAVVEALKAHVSTVEGEDTEKLDAFITETTNIVNELCLGNQATAKKNLETLLGNGNAKVLFKLSTDDLKSLLSGLTAALKRVNTDSTVTTDTLLASVVATLSKEGKETLKKNSALASSVKNMLGGAKESTQGPSVNDNIDKALAGFAMALQQLMMNIAQSQADQSDAMTKIGKAQIDSSNDNLKSVTEQLAKAQADAKAQKTTNFWLEIGGAILAVVSVVVAAVTFGVGAAITVGVVALLAALSPEITKAVATAIESANLDNYTQAFETEGYDSSKARSMAEAKCQAEAGIIVGVIVVAIAAALTLGVGGIVTGAAEASLEVADTATTVATTAVEDGTEIGDVVGEDLAEGAEDVDGESGDRSSLYKKTNGKLGWTSKGVKAMLVSNIANSVASSGLVQDTMLFSNTEWCYNNKTAMAIISALCTILLAVVGMVGGGKMMSARAGASAEMMSSSIGKLISKAALVGFTGGIAQGAGAGVEAGFQLDQANTYGLLAKIEKALMLSMFVTQGTETTSKSISNDGKAEQKTIGESIQTANRSMGLAMEGAAEALLSSY